MNNRLLFLGFVLIFLSNTCFSQNINISIFNSVKSNSINFTAVSGNYDIVSNNRIPHTIKEGENITIVNHRGNRVRVFDINMRQIGRYKHILLRGKKQSNYLKYP
jgi:hypothetical protein